MRKAHPSVVTLISAGLFFLSLISDCVYTARGGTAGYELLATGWLGALFMFVGLASNPAALLKAALPILGWFSWFANPLVALSWLAFLVGSRRYARAFAAGALALMLCSLAVREMPQGDAPSIPIVGYGVGYFLWIASAAVMLAADRLARPPAPAA